MRKDVTGHHDDDFVFYVTFRLFKSYWDDEGVVILIS